MLRPTLIAIVAVLLAVTVVLAFLNGPDLIGPTVMLSVVLIGLLFENSRYRRLSQQAPGGNFTPTGEKFVDPESGKLVEVHSDPATGC